MLIILYYCFKVIICSGVLFGYYLLALRNNRFHQWNRYYLLAAVVLAFTLPLLRIPVMFGGDSSLELYSYRILSGPDLYFNFAQKQEHTYITLPLFLLVIYTLIALIFVTVFIKNAVKIKTLKSRYPDEIINDVHFYNTQEAGTPFSFFKNIFWDSNIKLNTEKGQQMLRHEMTHVTEKHSIDKVLMEIVIAFAWWNPFMYFIRKELAVIHEFIADQKASAGDAKLQYASLLLMKAMGSEQYALGNPFFHSQLKRRLTMLTTSKFPKFGYIRRLIALPLASMLMMFFSVQCKRPHEDDKAFSQVEKNLKQDSVTAGKLPENVLYFINGVESSKKDVESLDQKEIKSMNVLKGNDAIKEYGNRGVNGVILISTKRADTEKVFSQVEEPASFPGGIDGWRRYLERNLKYPEAAQEKGTQGVVRMQMTLDEEGRIKEIKALNDPGDGLANEALRIIKFGPKWVPAKQNGEPVPYQFVQTITFQLQ